MGDELQCELYKIQSFNFMSKVLTLFVIPLELDLFNFLPPNWNPFVILMAD